MGQLKALHLVSTTDRRGAQVFASDLAAHLGGAPDHLVVAIAPGASVNRLACDALGRHRWDPLGFGGLVRLLRRRHVLVAHGSSALLNGSAAGAIARRPFVYRNIGDPGAWGAIAGADLRIGAPLRRAAAVAALYPAAREYLIDEYSLPPDAVETIPNGVPVPDGPLMEQGRARALFGLDDELRWAGFIGALTPEKGVLDAVTAIAADTSLGLVIAGDGPQRQEAERLGSSVAPGRVRFVGVLDGPWDLLSAVDVVVMTSGTEGIPATAIEAGMAARPVVATAVGGMAEVVDHTVTGLLVDDTDPATVATALRSAIANRERLGLAAQARCRERFSMTQVSQQWRALLDRVVGY